MLIFRFSFPTGNTPGTGPAALVATVKGMVYFGIFFILVTNFVPAGGSVTAKWAQWTHAEGPVMVVSIAFWNGFLVAKDDI